MALLEVRDLHVEFATPEGVVKAVDGLDFSLEEGETLGVIYNRLRSVKRQDVDAALAELRRILKPDGQLLFIEHVAAPAESWLCTCQHGIEPLWRRLADGCHPDRDTEAALRRQFEDVSVERFRTGLPVVSPHIMGTATV